MTKIRNKTVWVIGDWNLFEIWDLEFGIFCLRHLEDLLRVPVIELLKVRITDRQSSQGVERLFAALKGMICSKSDSIST